MKDNKSLDQTLKVFHLRFIFTSVVIIVTFMTQVSIARDNLVEAALAGDLEDVIFLVNDRQVDIDFRDSSQNTALIRAAFTGHIKIVEFLISKKANLDLQNDRGLTALMWTIYQGYKDIFRLLIKSGANPNLAAHNGLTPLILLAYQGDLESIQFLAEECDVDFNAQTPDGVTALMVAAYYGHTEIVKFLTQKRRTNPDLQAHGITALMGAISKGDKRVAKILVDAGADVMYIRDQEGLSALDYATIKEDAEMIDILLSKPEDRLHCFEALLPKQMH